MQKHTEHYFLGTRITGGFDNLFREEISDKRFQGYLLKGGPGTGKSSLMKRIGKAFEDSGRVTYYHCSSDPESLDAVVIWDKRAYICDATAPHVMDCRYPGVTERIVDLGRFWDEGVLGAFSAEIISAAERNLALQRAAGRIQQSLTVSCKAVSDAASECCNEKKLKAFSKRLAARLMGGASFGEKGTAVRRQLTALTEYGCMTFENTAEGFENVIVLSDSRFYAANRLCELLEAEALSRGLDVISCPSAAFDNARTEHLLMPSLGIAVLSDTPLTLLSGGGTRIDLYGFYDRRLLEENRDILTLEKCLISERSERLYETMSAAKAVHDELEKYYIKAMDFKGVGGVCEELEKRIGDNKKAKS